MSEQPAGKRIMELCDEIQDLAQKHEDETRKALNPEAVQHE